MHTTEAIETLYTQRKKKGNNRRQQKRYQSERTERATLVGNRKDNTHGKRKGHNPEVTEGTPLRGETERTPLRRNRKDTTQRQQKEYYSEAT